MPCRSGSPPIPPSPCVTPHPLHKQASQERVMTHSDAGGSHQRHSPRIPRSIERRGWASRPSLHQSPPSAPCSKNHARGSPTPSVGPLLEEASALASCRPCHYPWGCPGRHRRTTEQRTAASETATPREPDSSFGPWGTGAKPGDQEGRVRRRRIRSLHDHTHERNMSFSRGLVLRRKKHTPAPIAAAFTPGAPPWPKQSPHMHRTRRERGPPAIPPPLPSEPDLSVQELLEPAGSVILGEVAHDDRPELLSRHHVLVRESGSDLVLLEGDNSDQHDQEPIGREQELGHGSRERQRPGSTPTARIKKQHAARGAPREGHRQRADPLLPQRLDLGQATRRETRLFSACPDR